MNEETIKERARWGEQVCEEVRALQRASRIEGTIPRYVILSPTESEDLVDYLISQKLEDNLTVMGVPRIFGLEIITNEKEILRLNKCSSEQK